MHSFLLVSTFLVPALASATTQESQPQLLDVGRLQQSDPSVVSADARFETTSAAFEHFLKHYGSPSAGCEDDENSFQISGIPGGVCARKCADFLPCPTDVPKGVSATPMCALQDQSGNKYCILVCSTTTTTKNTDGNLRNGVVFQDDQCGEAICRPVPGQDGLGICTYDV